MAQYLFNLVSVLLVVSLNGNSPMEKQREWRVAVFPTPESGLGCHLVLFFFFWLFKTDFSFLALSLFSHTFFFLLLSFTYISD